MRFLFLLVLFSQGTASARDEILDLSKATFAPEREAILKIRYELACPPLSREFRGVPGKLGLETRALRFDLLEGTRETRVQLGRIGGLPEKPTVTLDETGPCKIGSFTYAFEEVAEEFNVVRRMALEHTPVLHIRKDQYQNRTNDLPLALGYSVKKSDETFTIVYTAFFSDEDSLGSTDEMDAQMTRYGRRADIEWVYAVEFNSLSLKVVSRKYHSDYAAGFGHATTAFRGKFLDTSHPLLYNIATHNVFSDRPTGKQKEEPIAYHLPPLQEIPQPYAREKVMFDHPWLFFQSDHESGREKKLSQGFEENLFLRLRGELKSGAIVAIVTLTDGTVFRSGLGKETEQRDGRKKGSIEKLGEGLWGEETYTSIPLGADRLEKFGVDLHGTVSFRAESGSPELSLKEIGIYRPRKTNGATVFEDISPVAVCELDGLNSLCKF